MQAVKEFWLLLASFVSQCSTLQEKEETLQGQHRSEGVRNLSFYMAKKQAPAFLGNSALHLQGNNLPRCSERAMYRNYPLSTASGAGWGAQCQIRSPDTGDKAGHATHLHGHPQ